ncbi:hypothetical protein NLX83_18270 [Allokutzneria sp. A3M-2-11 16]|uniref:hypothetical protein n=1 Tax=Allokutzneria sp. A3M-2-11 16 TaxID=2962043 RepID=UPI0020B831EA|nr:hypothetical protein [Allokutzneria sp. A3M-2-11 16]MCP3801209.1 hypothetical protein [Allokutzneria sp. A3M-2-11 16]
MPTTWDESGWPILRNHVTGGQSMADVQATLDRIGSYLDRGERFGLISTTTGVSRTESGTAKRQVEWATEHADRLRGLVVGWASVVAAEEVEWQSQRVAGMNKLVPFPLAVFATDAECADWLRDRL